MAQLAQILVRSVVRAFYDTDHVVVVDALVFHSALSLNDLAHVMDLSKHNKVVSRLCGKLKEGGIISVYSRQELREFATKPVAKEYYYIDYRRAIDAIKYRIHIVDEKIKSVGRAVTEKKDLVCPRCDAEWTHMEVLDSIDPAGRGSGFLCKRCHALLELRPDENDAEPEADDTPALFNKQFSDILSLLQQIDNVVVPAANAEAMVAEARPVQRDDVFNPAAKMETVSRPTVKPTAVRGITTGPEKIEISITTSSENTAAEQAAETERRARIAAQNQLPEWHTRSTVTGEATALGQREDAARREHGVNSEARSRLDEDEDEKKDRDPALDAYFAALRAEQERQAEEEDEDEEEEDEFEEVMVMETATAPSTKRDEGGEASLLKTADSSLADQSDADDFEDAL